MPSRRLTPLDPKEQTRARELERVLVGAAYSYADIIKLYSASLKRNANALDRTEQLASIRDQLSSAKIALADAALALGDVLEQYRP